MKIQSLLIISILSIVLAVITNTAFAAIIPSPFTSGTDKTEYDAGEIVKISGIIADEIIKPNQTISIDVFGPDGSLYKIATVDLEPQKTYSNGFHNYGYKYEYDLKIGNDANPGPYQIVLYYDKSQEGGDVIIYDANHVDYNQYFIFNTFLGNTSYQIRYKVTQGNELQGLGVDTTNKIFYISVAGSELKTGQLTLELPRKIIDSKYDNGTDKNYIVDMGATGAAIINTNDFKEIQNNYENRTLQFSIPPYNASYTIMLFGTSINQSETITSTSLSSPLKQFKSGIKAENITCENKLQLVIKAEDGSPACVRYDTAQTLIQRGWAKEIVSQIETQTSSQPSTEAIAPCQTPFEKNTTLIQVLYMPMDSTGMICIQYSNQNQNPVPVGINILESKNLTQQASDIAIHANATSIKSGNSTVVYTIHTGPQAGFYQLSVFCGGMPFTVGYDNQSRIVADDFPWLYKTVYCLNSSYDFKVVGLSGIGVTNLK